MLPQWRMLFCGGYFHRDSPSDFPRDPPKAYRILPIYHHFPTHFSRTSQRFHTQAARKAPKFQERFPKILERFLYASTFLHSSPEPPRNLTHRLHAKLHRQSKTQEKLPRILEFFPYTSTFLHSSPEPPKDFTHRLHAKLHNQSIAKLQKSRMHWFRNLKNRYRVLVVRGLGFGVW